MSVWEGPHVGAGEEHEEEEVAETKYYDCLSLDCAVVCQYAASVCTNIKSFLHKPLLPVD